MRKYLHYSRNNGCARNCAAQFMALKPGGNFPIAANKAAINGGNNEKGSGLQKVDGIQG